MGEVVDEPTKGPSGQHPSLLELVFVNFIIQDFLVPMHKIASIAIESFEACTGRAVTPYSG